MKHMNVIFLLLVSNVVVAMEPERKQLTWRVDRKIESGKQAGFYHAWFNKQGTKIMSELSDEDDDRVYVWNRLDGTRVGKRFSGIFETELLSDEWGFDDSSEEGLAQDNDERIFNSRSSKEESAWLNELCKKISPRPDTIKESKKNMVVSFCNQSMVYVWDREGNKEVQPLVHHDKIESLRLCKSGKIITNDDVVRTWDASTGKELFKIMSDKPVRLLDVYKSEKIITTSDDHVVRIWDINKEEELFNITFDQAVISAGFNISETEMVVVTEDGKIQILVQETK
jgi:WD40 repeat protein